MSVDHPSSLVKGGPDWWPTLQDCFDLLADLPLLARDSEKLHRSWIHLPALKARERGERCRSKG
jgi:hypothetical protein